jgi:hypothetical protein
MDARAWLVVPVLRAVTGLPLVVAAVVLALVGRPGAVTGHQLRLAGRPAVPVPTRGRVLAHSLALLVPALAAFVLVALLLGTLFSGYLFPLRPDLWPMIAHPLTADARLADAWGGPTLMGAWAGHAVAALAFQVAALALIHTLVHAQDTITARLL